MGWILNKDTIFFKKNICINNFSSELSGLLGKVLSLRNRREVLDVFLQKQLNIYQHIARIAWQHPFCTPFLYFSNTLERTQQNLTMKNRLPDMRCKCPLQLLSFLWNWEAFRFQFASLLSLVGRSLFASSVFTFNGLNGLDLEAKGFPLFISDSALKKTYWFSSTPPQKMRNLLFSALVWCKFSIVGLWLL